MAIIISLIFLGSLTGFVLGLIKPDLVVKFKLPKTRLISSAIYGGIMILSGIVISNMPVENTPNNINHRHDYLEKWNNLSDKKITNYINEKIAGEWHLDFAVFQDYNTGEITKVSHHSRKQGNQTVYLEKFEDKQYVVFEGTGYEDLSQSYKTHFNIKGDSLFIDLTDRYKVMYISPNLLVRKQFDVQMNTSMIEVLYKDSTNFKDERNQYFNYLNTENRKRMIEANLIIDNNDSTNFANAHATIINCLISDKLNSIINENISNKGKDSLSSATQINLDKIDKFMNEFSFLKFKSLFESVPKEPGGDIYIGKVNNILYHLNADMAKRKMLNLDNTIYNILYDSKSNEIAKFKKEYDTYGVGGDTFLRLAAEDYLVNHLKDPNSLKIVDAYINKKANEGWVYYIKYRAKNSFGAYNLEDALILIKYDPESKLYYGVKHW